MAVERAECIIMNDLRAEEINLEGVALDSLEPILPLLGKMPRLKVLRLAQNKLTGLPSDLSCIRQLEYLDISANPITGLSSIISGLYSLVILRHLYVDLPFESEEDEIIISLQSLESFNGTSLTMSVEGDASENKNNMKPPLQSWAGKAAETSTVAEDFHPQHPQWTNGEMADMQDLFTMIVEATGNTATQKEFNMFLENVVHHLSALTSNEMDAAAREGETLKAKNVLLEYCFDELCNVTGRKDAALGRAFSALSKVQVSVMERYDGLWRRIAGDKNERIALMKKDMQDAIHEIESLMSQVGHAASANVGGGVGADEAELQRLQEEVGRLRTENERLQTKLRLLETTGSAGNASAFAALRNPSSSVERGQPSPSRSQGPPVGNKVLTLKQLKSTIEDIYASKSKYDIKCSESRLPRETMEQHMYTYLNQRYGLKHIILDWATAIIHGVKKYALEDNDVAVFGKILRNEIDEEFRFVQRQVRETVHELLRVYVKGKRPSKSDMEINKIVQRKCSETLLEDEWVDIVKYMYNTEDALSIIMRVRDHIRQVLQPHLRRAIQRGHEPPSNDSMQLPYVDLIRILLDFQLEGHERFLARFLAVFREHDTDRNGIINEREFAAVLKGIDASKTDEEINAILELIDPFDNQLITYSECVTFLSAEIVKMMKGEEGN